ncbi:MAG TPA: DUF6036 family nucleotidyltransferase [Acetobacteraceae bacterium]|nr:DUF6036 family nucleotidyltransferase [Acetobacteraceae bacterium]
MTDLDHATIEQAFQELGDRLRRQQRVGDIAVYGGAAMILHFGINRVTHDVDAVIETEHGPVQQAVREIGRIHGWGESWLNESVSVYLAQAARLDDISLFRSYPTEGMIGLRVFVANPRYMLAMKLAALRTGTGQRDKDDVLVLARATSLTTAEQLIALHKTYYPSDPLDARKLVIIGEIAELLNASPDTA